MAGKSLPRRMITGLMALLSLSAASRSTSSDLDNETDPSQRVVMVDHLTSYVAAQLGGGGLTPGAAISNTSGTLAVDLSGDTDVNLGFSGSGNGSQLRLNNTLVNSSGASVLDIANSQLKAGGVSYVGVNYTASSRGAPAIEQVVLQNASSSLTFEGSTLTSSVTNFGLVATGGARLDLGAGTLATSNGETSVGVNGSLVDFRTSSTSRVTITDNGVQFGSTGPVVTQFSNAAADDQTKAATIKAVWDALGGAASMSAGTNIALNAGQISVVDAPTFAGAVTANAGVVIADGQSLTLNTVALDTVSADASGAGLDNGTIWTAQATKDYVDTLFQGVDYKDSVRAASTGNVDVNSAPSAIDTINLSAGDRVLLKDQTDTTQNGIWVFNGATSALTRAADFDAGTEINGAYVYVLPGGPQNGGVNFRNTDSGSITVGTDAINFTEVGGLAQVTAGAALTKTGNTLDVQVLANGGLEIVADKVQLQTTFAGDGISLTSGVAAIDLAANSGLAFNSGQLQLDSTLAGNVLNLTNGVLDLNFNSTSFTNDSGTFALANSVAGTALKLESGALEVEFDDTTIGVTSNQLHVKDASLGFDKLHSDAVATDISLNETNKVAQSAAVKSYVDSQIGSRITNPSRSVVPNDAPDGTRTVFVFPSALAKENVIVHRGGALRQQEPRNAAGQPTDLVAFDCAVQSDGTNVTVTFHDDDVIETGEVIAISGVLDAA